MPQLVEFLDAIADMSCMVYNDVQKVYLPHSLDWIKSRVYHCLKKNATRVDPPEDATPCE